MISYKDSGVDKEEGYRSVDKIKKAAAETHIPGVLNGLGSFASMFQLSGYKEPVLVSGTDGVGTKLEVAFSTKTYDTVGQDCFAMCANDILCHGAQPLFFLDYLACGKLDSSVSAQLVGGVAEACKEAGCALVGGETAEMPGFYKEGDYDMAGFCVGAAEKDQIINGSDIKEGDVVIGLASNGLHSNGFSLVRKLLPDYNEDFQGQPLYKELLKPTRIYVKPVLELLKKITVKGMAHITGGGLLENVPRTLPKGLSALIDKKAIEIPAIFKLLQERGVKEEEMWGTFNMGVGFVVVCSEEDKQTAVDFLSSQGIKSNIIGKIIKSEEGVCFA